MSDNDNDHIVDLDAEESEAESATGKKKRKHAKGKGEEPALKVVDRRFWARRDRSGEGEGGVEGEAAGIIENQNAELGNLRSEAENLRRDLETRDAKVRELTEAYLGLKDETERFRVRSDRESGRKLAAAKAGFLKDLLPILDSFERAQASLAKSSEADVYRQGLEMILGQFQKFLATAGLERFDPKGQTFDPNTAEAVEVAMVEDDALDNVVVETLAAGYRLGESLLRPANVRVGKKAAAKG